MTPHPVFYIDPQSYKNLAIYDYSLLTNLSSDQPVIFFGSRYYDYKPLPTTSVAVAKGIFTYNRKRHAFTKALSYVWSYILILGYIIRLRPRLIHFQWFKLPTFDLWIVRLLKRFTNIRIVHTAHNLLPHDTGTRYRDVYAKLYHAVDRIVVHTQLTKQQLVEMFGEPESKIAVIPHGILKLDVPPQQLAAAITKYDNHYFKASPTGGGLEGALVFTSLGEQTRYKGTDLLAEAWLSTPELSENPNLRLIVVGNNDGDVDLTQLAQCQNAIVENRRIPDDEFLYLLRHTDVYLLPYRRISQSGALLTALGEHVPILVSNVGALAEPLATANVGWLIGEPTVEALRRQLLHIANHPDEPRNIKTRDKDWLHVCNQYDWHNIGRLTSEIYDCRNAKDTNIS